MTVLCVRRFWCGSSRAAIAGQFARHAAKAAVATIVSQNVTVEGFNNKAKLTIRKAYGFRTYKAAEIALYHSLAKLPEPEFTHEFC